MLDVSPSDSTSLAPIEGFRFGKGYIPHLENQMLVVCGYFTDRSIISLIYLFTLPSLSNAVPPCTWLLQLCLQASNITS